MGAAPKLPGRASQDPLRLCPCVREKFLDFVGEAKGRGIDLIVVETWRDFERQKHYKAIGTSRTLNSYHLPQPPCGLSLAFDVVPKAYVRLKLWYPGGPLWLELGEIGRGLGLEWGGDWRGWKDRAHFQIRRCACVKREKAE